MWLEQPLGLELRGDVVLAYWRLDDAPAREETPGLELLSEDVLSEEDWASGWRAAAEPFALGDRFWIDPGESAGAAAPQGGAPGDRVALRLPARRAFGTGSHPSTRLAVAWLEEVPLAGRDVLDLGAGSGILSFVARALGARLVVGVELDLESVLLAGANRRTNGIEIALVGGTRAALDASFDVIVANLLSSELRPELDALATMLAPRGALVYSGALQSERDELVALFEDKGLAVAGEKSEGEWSSWLLGRGRAVR